MKVPNINDYIAAKAGGRLVYYNAAENKRIFELYITGAPVTWSTFKSSCLEKAAFLAKRAGKLHIKQNYRRIYSELRGKYTRLPF